MKPGGGSDGLRFKKGFEWGGGRKGMGGRGKEKDSTVMLSNVGGRFEAHKNKKEKG